MLHRKKNFALEELRISRVFFKFHGGFSFFENVKKQSNYRFRFPLQLQMIQRIFFTIIDKSTGHRVTRFYPVFHIVITLKFHDTMSFFLL